MTTGKLRNLHRGGPVPTGNLLVTLAACVYCTRAQVTPIVNNELSGSTVTCSAWHAITIAFAPDDNGGNVPRSRTVPLKLLSGLMGLGVKQTLRHCFAGTLYVDRLPSYVDRQRPA